MHQPLLLLALLPLAALIWWTVRALREAHALHRDIRQAQAELKEKYPWLREFDE